MAKKKTHAGKFAAMESIREGDLLVADAGWTCLKDGEIVVVRQDSADGRLYVLCGGPQHETAEHPEPKESPYRLERHYLDGQSSKEGANPEAYGRTERCVGLHYADPEATRARLAETQESLRKMLQVYWGAGDKERPPEFIAKAAILAGWEITPWET